MAVYQIKKGCGDFIGKPDAKGNRITHKALDRIQSDEDLETKWPGRFTLISASDELPASKAPKIPDGKKVKKDKKTTLEVEYNKDGTVYKDMEDPIKKIPVENEHGVDVSKDFPTAAKVDLQVFEKSKWFTVVDPDNGEVLNDKKLRKSKVEDFLADYLDDNEDAEDEDEDEDEEDTEDDDEDEDEEE